MLNRWIGILTGAAMLVANAAIFMHDIWPSWAPNDPPPSDANLLSPGQHRNTQVGFYTDEGRLVGRSWTQSERHAVGELTEIRTTILIDSLRLPNVATPPVRLETTVYYKAKESWIDEVAFKMYGLGMPISLRGETMTPEEFAGSWQVGLQKREFLLQGGAPAALGDVLRPFDRLPNLYVGQVWRIKLLDSLGLILPQLREGGLEPEPITIRVTEKRTLDHRGAKVGVFVVVSDRATAFVDESGQVLRQELELPLLGKLILLDEPFEERALGQARKRVPVDWGLFADDEEKAPE